jgi:hypothetical protein
MFGVTEEISYLRTLNNLVHQFSKKDSITDLLFHPPDASAVCKSFNENDDLLYLAAYNTGPLRCGKF